MSQNPTNDHTQFMADLRASFAREWETNLLPVYRSLSLSERSIALIQLDRWREWKEKHTEPKEKG